MSLIAAAALLVALAALTPSVLAGERPMLGFGEFLPGIEVGFRVEPLGLGFALVAATLWPVTVVYSIGYMRAHGERHQTRFYAFFALAIAAVVGAAFAGDLLTLYVFYEALTLATYPLVTHGGENADRLGGRTYLRVLLGTSLTFLLFAIAWTYSLAGTLSFVEGGVFLADGAPVAGVTSAVLAVLYALYLFGTGKAALMPFHRWLPAAMVAPTPVSALLHAVAVVKLGVFTVLKVSVYTFGVDVLTRFDAATLMQYVAAATLLSAAVLALREDNLKRRLAYSTVSQLSYVVLAATLASGTAVLAAGLHIAAHAFAKITLFFCAGAILVSLHKTTISSLRGAGRLMPWTFTAWIVASACVIGLPLTGGFWSKWYLARGAFDAGEPLILGVVLLGSLLAMGYLLPPAVQAFLAPAARETSASPKDGAVTVVARAAEAPRAVLLAIAVTAAATVLLFFAVEPMARLLGAVSLQGAG
jgi:multicomponent Na+:H+ antiporter subunit D